MNIFNKENVDIVFYHKNCHDGFGAAFSVHYWFKQNKIDRLSEIKFIPVTHGHKINETFIKDKNVLICDFCYDKTTISMLEKCAKSLLIIDHHKTSERILEKFEANIKIFDLNHSGAYLTWKYFFEDEPILFIRYIEDRDIWGKKYIESEYFNIVLNKTPYEFSEYEKYVDENKLNEEIYGGKNIYENDMINVVALAKNSTLMVTNIKEEYYFVVYVNSGCYQSDLGSYLVGKLFPLADLAAVYYYNATTDTTHYSLRSLENKTDCSRIAEKFGGGGHPCASGIMLKGVRCKLDIGLSPTESHNLYKILTTGIKSVESKSIFINHYDITYAETFDVLIKRMYNTMDYIIFYRQMIDEDGEDVTNYMILKNCESWDYFYDNFNRVIIYKKHHGKYLEIKAKRLKNNIHVEQTDNI